MAKTADNALKMALEGPPADLDSLDNDVKTLVDKLLGVLGSSLAKVKPSSTGKPRVEVGNLVLPSITTAEKKLCEVSQSPYLTP